MNKFMTATALLLVSIMTTNVWAEKKPDISDYAFEKNILVKNYGKEVKVPLDKEVLKNTKRDFSNFAIFDGLNQNVDFDVFLDKFKILKDVKVLDVSSMREIEGQNSQKSDIADDNHFTVFNFSERIDRANASWAIFDLGESYPLSRIEIFFPTRSKIKYFEIKAGNDLDNLKTIVAKKIAKPIYNKITLSTPAYRYFKISFWGVNVRVEDIRFTTAAHGAVYFTPEQGKKYFARYGNDSLKFFEFKQRLNQPKEVTETAYFSKQKWNKRAKEDLDGDGIKNKEDNCPFVANRFQSDSDKDGVGNDCDNAPDKINVDQTDTDGDGVGDVVDNCELYPNPDQANKDGDEYGDVCDGADSDSASALSNISLPIGKNFAENKLVYGILALLVVMGIIYFVKTKKK